jgi:hypothetical protein
MEPHELEERLRAGGRIWCDTNAAWGNAAAFLDLCDQVARWREQSEGRPLTISLSPIVLLEKALQERHHRGPAFLPERFLDVIESKRIEVMPMDLGEALSMAEALARHYPDRDSWTKARKHAAGGRDLMTVDWVIVAQAIADGGLAVSADKGTEWAHGVERTTVEAVSGALKALLSP